MLILKECSVIGETIAIQINNGTDGRLTEKSLLQLQTIFR